MEIDKHERGSKSRQTQNDTSRDTSQPSRTKDYLYPQQADHHSLHLSQAMSKPNAAKNPAQIVAVNSKNETQLLGMQRIAEPPAITTGQAAPAMNQASSIYAPLAKLLRVIMPQLDKDKAMQLQGLFAQFRNDNISKEYFVRHMKTIVGDHMLKMTVFKVIQEQYKYKMADKYHLSEDLIVGIFERLPPKSLIRFRSLSKSWCSLIASAKFICNYTLRSKENSSLKLLIRNDKCDNEKGYRELYRYIDVSSTVEYGHIDISSTVEFPYIYTSIVNSCNGIFCLCDRDNFNNITLWNPSIRCNLSLPDHPSFDGNPRLFSTAVGLGFDPITDDYKIVRIYRGNKEAQQSSLVYSMKAHSWCAIASPAYPFQFIGSDTCFFNTALHWVARYLRDHFIITFDLSTNVFGKIMLPKPRWQTEKPTIIKGCLAVLSYESDFNCWIWVMKEYNDAASWYVLFKFETDPDLEGGMKQVLQLIPEGYFLINTYLGGIEIYDLATGMRSVLVEHSFRELEMAMCLESIELLDRGVPD